MIIDAILEDEWKYQLARRTFQRPNEIHVTELCGCRKKSEFFQKFKEVMTINPAIIVGRFVHRGLQEWLKENYDVEVEKEFRKPLRGIEVVGIVDAISDEWVFEIKYTKDVYESEPYEHHLRQCRLYLWLTEYEKAKLIYISPEKLLEFNIYGAPSDDDVLAFYDTWSSPMWDWECGYCPFSAICPKRVDKKRR